MRLIGYWIESLRDDCFCFRQELPACKGAIEREHFRLLKNEAARAGRTLLVD